jgi:hypothetical protein
MAVVAHTAKMARPAKDGSSSRDHLLFRAKQGNAVAIAELAEPPYPETLEYLHGWFGKLNGMRREGMSSIAPFTSGDILAADQLFDWGIEPHEAEALVVLDGAWRAALRDDGKKPAERAEEQPTPAWPTKKRSV